MSIFSKLGALIFAPTDAAGNPRQVINHDAQVWSTEVERIIQVALEGGDLLVYGSLSALNADLDHPAHTGAILIGESIADDGLYMKQGASGSGAWVKTGNVPGQGFVRATNAGAGTENAIEATTPVAVNETQLILLPIVTANTSETVTVSFNDGAELQLKTASNETPLIGGLKVGATVLGFIEGDGATFRLLSVLASDLTWRGAWADAVTYARKDAVKHNGASYIATDGHVASSSTEPGVGADWGMVWDTLAQKGDAGVGEAMPAVANTVPVRKGDNSQYEAKPAGEAGLAVLSAATLEAARRKLATFDAISGLEADNTFSYSAAPGKIVVATNDYFTAQGLRYRVADSGASDHDLETAGGVKLYEEGPPASSTVTVAQTLENSNFGLIARGRSSPGDAPLAFYRKLAAAPSAPDQRHFQDASGQYFEAANVRDIRSFGADPTGGGDIGPIIEMCLNEGIVPEIKDGTYRWQTKVTVPANKRLLIKGDPSASIITTEDVILLEYVRTGGTLNATWLLMKDLFVYQTGTNRTGYFCKFHGENVTYDDNRVSMIGGRIDGFKRGFDLKHTSGKFHQLFTPFNEVPFFMDYNASFCDFVDILAMHNEFFVYGEAGATDSISNSLNFERCTSVFSEMTDIRLHGWDAVNVNGGGCDLGGSGNGAGQNAIWLSGCTNVNIQNHYLSSNNDADSGGPGVRPSDNRVGLNLVGCRKVSLTGSRVYTSRVGMKISPNAFADAHAITGNWFGGNTANHIFLDGAKGGVISGNFFDDTPDRTGTNYPIYGNVPGVSNWYLGRNMFAGVDHTITLGGTNNQIDAQHWGVPF